MRAYVNVALAAAIVADVLVAVVVLAADADVVVVAVVAVVVDGWDVSRRYSAAEKCHECQHGFLLCRFHFRHLCGDYRCQMVVLAFALVVVVVFDA
jgi:hypothetical protein